MTNVNTACIKSAPKQNNCGNRHAQHVFSALRLKLVVSFELQALNLY